MAPKIVLAPITGDRADVRLLETALTMAQFTQTQTTYDKWCSKHAIKSGLLPTRPRKTGHRKPEPRSRLRIPHQEGGRGTA